MRKKLLFIFIVTVFVTKAIGSVTLILPDLSGANGSQITVPVKIKNFQNIISAQGTIQFDPAIVTYSSVQQFGLSGMNASSFGITGISGGKLTFSWYDGTLAGVSLADSTTVFSITFNVIGTNTQVSALSFVNTPTLIEVVDSAFNTLTTVLDNGSITVQNPANPTDITLFLDSCAGSTGSQVNVSMRAIDFININSLQGTIQFDPAIVTYSSVQQFALSGMNASSFGITGISGGKLTFSWYDGTLAGVSLADSTTVFSITFNVIGTNNQVSALSFVNTPTLIEVVDSAFNTLTTVLVNGSITVQNTSTGIIYEKEFNSHLLVYPNPNTGSFNLKYDSDSENKFIVNVINSIGETIFTKEYSKTSATSMIPFDLSKYNNGIYTIEVINKNKINKSRIILNN